MPMHISLIINIMNMVQNIEKLLQSIYNSNDEIIYIYPHCEKNENSFTPKVYSLSDVNKIKQKYSTATVKKIVQTETFFRDLVKVEINGDIESRNYIKKKILYDYLGDVLIAKIFADPIEEQKFPILSKYHNVDIKNIEVIELSSIDILINKNNNQYQICLSIKNKSTNLKKRLASELSEILKIIL